MRILADTPTFRNGHPGDLEAFCQLALAAYGTFENTLGKDGWAKMAAGCGSSAVYQQLMAIGHSFVCERGGKMIGMAFLVPSGNPVRFFQSDWAYIRLIAVDPQHSGKGIGRKLTQLCIDTAKQNGEKTVALHTSEFQEAARHIYESMGFKQLRALDPQFGKRYWLYTLDLTKNEAATHITYKQATLDDLQDLVELRTQFTTLLTGINDPIRVENLRTQMIRYFSQVLSDGSTYWMLARCGEEAVGTGGMILRQQPPNFKNPNGRMGYLVNMYTVPRFRRKGICSHILQKLVNIAAENGIQAFELHATKEGELIYGQLGFEVHDEPTYRKYI